MNDAVDSAGMIATGALLAREAERTHAPGHDASPDCANCGAHLLGPHCHVCGQHGHVHRTAGAFVHDILHGVFHFEGKFWKTLPMLAWRPGELTRRYVHGERAKFVSPMALFLFSVFLMFAVVANLPGWDWGGDKLLTPGAATRINEARREITKERKDGQAEVARLAERLKARQTEAEPDAEAITSAEKRLQRAQQRLREATQAEQALARISLDGEETLPDIKAAPGSAGGNWIEEKYQHAKENPKLLLYKVKTSAYKFSWALIPLSLPFIWLLFPFRRGVGMYDHAVFATYSLSFMSLLVITLAVLGAVGVPGGLLLIAWLLIPPFHMYRQLKGGYSLSRAGALVRTAVLLFFTTITSTLFILLLLYLGVAD
ncbi:Protein of unknown function [Sphingomonas guangdongensis]|uniref:DUF3667 domain-containing protein n=1 Tax=Sphingomonas guangdongensis TaxID=1141890 RepID=A0A285QE33_9SPHN|nr:DUF3667 domain-containing protein [Sphingomonas guangdongensis]SOB80106.1 Protein of unknown function [Sphingomonas guangdongensis]